VARYIVRGSGYTNPRYPTRPKDIHLENLERDRVGALGALGVQLSAAFFTGKQIYTNFRRTAAFPRLARVPMHACARVIGGTRCSMTHERLLLWLALLGSESAAQWPSSSGPVVTAGPITEVHGIFGCKTDYTAQLEFAADARSLFTPDWVEYNFTHCIGPSRTEPQSSSDAIIDPILESATGRVAFVTNIGFQRGILAALSRAAITAGAAIFNVGKFPPEPSWYPGLNLTQHLMLGFGPDREAAASYIGYELCRRHGQQATLRVATIYAYSDTNDVQIDAALQAFATSCRATKVEVVASTRTAAYQGGPSEQLWMEAVLVADPNVQAVITSSDAVARYVVAAADRVLTPPLARALFVSGWGYDEEIQPYLNRDRVFATTRDISKLLWRTFEITVRQVSERGWASTAEVQDDMPPLGDGYILKYHAILMPSDAEGYLINRLLTSSSYNPVVRPLPQGDLAAAAADGGAATSATLATLVTVGVTEMVVDSINVPANTFQATFWLMMQWEDKRLEWPARQYSGTIQLPKEQVWTPSLYATNHLSELMQREAGDSQVTLRSYGLVSWAQKITGEFDCKMRVEPYPYDIHTCFINISTDTEASKVNIEPGLDYEITGWEEGYDITLVPPYEGCIDSTASPVSLEQARVTYEFKIIRNPDFVITTYVMMAWLLVILTFMQFWIPEESGNMDRAGITITTVLATIVLLTEAAVSKARTWLSLFFIVCIAYEALSFFTTIVVGRRFGHRAKQIARRPEPSLHPGVSMSSFRRSGVCSPSDWGKEHVGTCLATARREWGSIGREARVSSPLHVQTGADDV